MKGGKRQADLLTSSVWKFNPTAVYPPNPPINRPKVVLPQEAATNQLSAVHAHGHATPAAISPCSSNVLTRDLSMPLFHCHCWRTSQLRHDSGEMQELQRMRQKQNRHGSWRVPEHLCKPEKTGGSTGEVQCVHQHRNCSDKPKAGHCQQLMEERASLKNLLSRLALML